MVMPDEARAYYAAGWLLLSATTTDQPPRPIAVLTPQLDTRQGVRDGWHAAQEARFIGQDAATDPQP